MAKGSGVGDAQMPPSAMFAILLALLALCGYFWIWRPHHIHHQGPGPEPAPTSVSTTHS